MPIADGLARGVRSRRARSPELQSLRMSRKRREGPPSRAGSENAGKARGPSPRPLNRQALGRRILSDLRQLSRLLIEENGLSIDEEDLRTLEAQIVIEVLGPNAHARIRRRARGLVEDLERRLRELASASDEPTDGRVYCFRCESGRCEHVRPRSPQEVFAGYDTVGRPVFRGFPSLILEQRPERADALFAEPHRVVAVTQDRAALDGDQLSAFGRGSRVYEVLGQVCAGLFPEPAGAGNRPIRHALTIVRRLDASRRAQIELNAIGGQLDDEPLAALRPRDREMIVDLLRQARTRLVRARTPRHRDPTPQEVRGFLGWLGRGLEHAYRQRSRRTRHALERAEDSARPTHKALEDARRASTDRLHIDMSADTFVLLGPRRRVHVYSLSGRQVTSLVVDSDDVRRRLRDGRWRPATPEEWHGFRAVLGLDAAPGDTFDPNQHEALMRQPSEEHETGAVAQQLQPGYTMAGKPLRPVKVAVVE